VLEDKVTWSVSSKKRSNNEAEVISAKLSGALDTATNEIVNEEESACGQVRAAGSEQIYVINERTNWVNILSSCET
jgi:hypothetical protein